MERTTTYSTAVHWLHNNMILCNSIVVVDPSVYDEMRFSTEDEDGNYKEIYQWYITDCSLHDVEYLEESFGLLFTYSNALDCFVLCVDHFGTAWNGVYCPCYNDDIPDSLLHKDGDF